MVEGPRRSSELAALACALSDLRLANDARYARVASSSPLSLLPSAALTRYLNEAHLAAELQTLHSLPASAPLPPPPSPPTASEWIGAWAASPRGLAAIISRLPTLRALLSSLPRTHHSIEGASLAPLSDLELISPEEFYPLIARPLRFALLRIRSPSSGDTVLRLVLGGMSEAEVSPHLPPLRGWRLAPLPPPTIGELRIEAHRVEGESLASLLQRKPSLDELYARGVAYEDVRPPPTRRVVGSPSFSGFSSEQIEWILRESNKPPSKEEKPQSPLPRLHLAAVPSSATDCPPPPKLSPPPPPTDPRLAFGDFVLFAVAHTLAIAQDAIELYCGKLGLSDISLVSADQLVHRGQPLSLSPRLEYSWGGEIYSFPTPRLLPLLCAEQGALRSASARLDGVLLDRPPPSLLPPPSELSDLSSFYASARNILPCGEVVSSRLELLLAGAPYDARSLDPWEQYRLPHPTAQPVASLECEWFPPAEVGSGKREERRDCSAALIPLLGVERLEALRDRARSLEEGRAVEGEEGDEWLIGQAARLEELCERERAGEAALSEAREQRNREAATLRCSLHDVTSERMEAACSGGWDGLSVLVSELLGAGAWERTLVQLPDEWDEEEAIANLTDALRRSDASPHFWLLLSPAVDAQHSKDAIEEEMRRNRRESMRMG